MRCVCVLDSEFLEHLLESLLLRCRQVTRVPLGNCWGVSTGQGHHTSTWSHWLMRQILNFHKNQCAGLPTIWSGGGGPMGVDGLVKVGECVFAWSSYWEMRWTESRFIRKHTGLELYLSSFLACLEMPSDPCLSFQLWENQTFRIILSYIAGLRPAWDIWEQKTKKPTETQNSRAGQIKISLGYICNPVLS